MSCWTPQAGPLAAATAAPSSRPGASGRARWTSWRPWTSTRAPTARASASPPPSPRSSASLRRRSSRPSRATRPSRSWGRWSPPAPASTPSGSSAPTTSHGPQSPRPIPFCPGSCSANSPCPEPIPRTTPHAHNASPNASPPAHPPSSSATRGRPPTDSSARRPWLRDWPRTGWRSSCATPTRSLPAEADAAPYRTRTPSPTTNPSYPRPTAFFTAARPFCNRRLPADSAPSPRSASSPPRSTPSRSASIHASAAASSTPFWSASGRRLRRRPRSRACRSTSATPCSAGSLTHAFAKDHAHPASGWPRAYLRTERRRLLKLLGLWLDYEANERAPFTVQSREETLRDVQIGPLRLNIRVDRVDCVHSRRGNAGPNHPARSFSTTRPAPPPPPTGWATGPTRHSFRSTPSSLMRHISPPSPSPAFAPAKTWACAATKPTTEFSPRLQS